MQYNHINTNFFFYLGATINNPALAAPAPGPKSVIASGFPLKTAILSCTHRSAID